MLISALIPFILSASNVLPPPSSEPYLLEDDSHIHTIECAHEFDPELAALQQKLMQSGTLPNALDSDEPVQVNVAIWYPPTWREMVGDNEVDARIDYLIARANRAFADSYVNVQINVVFAKEMAHEYYDERTGELRGSTLFTQPMNVYPRTWMVVHSDSNLDTDFPRMTYGYGADVALWIQERNIDNGFTHLGLASNAPDTYVGFASVVDQGIVAGERLTQEHITPAAAEIGLNATADTITHEIGHTLGLHHDAWYYDRFYDGWELDGYATACGFPFEMRENELLGIEIPRHRVLYATTVMHGGGAFSSPPHLVFSNPELLIGADYCGDYEYANQARVLNETVALWTQPKIMSPHDPVMAESVHGQTWLGSSLYEANEQKVIVDVHRNGDLSVATHVEVTAFNGTAIAGVDYSGAKLKASFEPGESQTTVVFDISEQASQDGLFTIRLQYPFGLEITEQYAIATTSALDNSTHRGDFSIPATFELTSRELRHIPITRSGDLSRSAVVLARTVDGTAKAGQNYQRVVQPIYFAPGESSQVIPIYGHQSSADMEFYVELSSPLNVGFINERTTVHKLNGYRGQVAFTKDFDEKSYLRRSASGINLAHSSGSGIVDVPNLCGNFRRYDLTDEQYEIGIRTPDNRGFANSPRTFNKVAHCMVNYHYHENTWPAVGLNQELTFTLERYNGSRGDLTFTVRPIGHEDINFHCQDVNPEPHPLEMPYCDSDERWDSKLLSRDIVESGDQTFTLADGEESMTVTVRLTDEAAQMYDELLRDGEGRIIGHSTMLIVFTEHDELFINTSEHRFFRLPEAARIYFSHIIAATNDDDNGDDDNGDGDGNGDDDSGTTPPPPPPPPAETKGGSTDFGFLLVILIAAFAVRRRKLS